LEQEYGSLFPAGGTAEACARKLKERGLTGQLRGTRLRSVVWKVLLEVLPPYVQVSEWPARIAQARKDYAALCTKHYVDPHATTAATAVADTTATIAATTTGGGGLYDDVIATSSQTQAQDPLSQSEDSPWNQYFRNAELQKEINRDLERTYPEHEFFQTDATRGNLNRILFVYAREHPDVMYRQGMHELLAPIYYVVHEEARTPPPVVAGDAAESEAAAALRVILDPQYIEHDSFALFTALMHNAAEFFLSARPAPKAQQQQQQDAIDGSGKKSPSAEQEPTPIVRRCRRIHHVLLKSKDPRLYDHLVTCNIEPQLYGLRWLRLLFGREFHLQDLLVLWDAIFAYGRSLALVDYICVAMLIYIREQLLCMDEVTAMKRILKYPPVEDISLFVIKAVELCTPRTSPGPAAQGQGQQQQTPGQQPSPPAISTGVPERAHQQQKEKEKEHHIRPKL
jgi:TBC1 domain family protein 5